MTISSKKKSHFFFVLVPVLVLSFATVFFLGSYYIGPYITQRFIAYCATKRVKCKLENLNVSVLPFSLNGSKLQAKTLHPSLFSELEVNEFTLRVFMLPLLSLRAKIDLFGNVYSGKFTSRLNRRLLSSNLEGALEIAGLQLNQYPSFRLLGLESGSLSLRAEDLLFNSERIMQGKFWGKINNFTILPSEHALVGLLLPFPPPLLKKLSLVIQGTWLNDKLILDTIECTSNLGNAKGKFEIEAHDKTKLALASIKGELDLRLTKQGIDKVGQFLQLMRQKNTAGGNREFKIEFGGTIKQPDIRVL